jgi:hypothetical protein
MTEPGTKQLGGRKLTMFNYIYHSKGIYLVNNKFFYNKIDAILEANITGQSVSWDYHDAEFAKFNWEKEPSASLDELYKQRALQLREAYDHLAIFFSGGVDSWNILYTFLKNNIPFEEIYIYGAFEAEESKIAMLGDDKTPGYYTREIKRVLPLIKKLIENKNIRLHVYDWTRDIIDTITNDPDWFYLAGVRFDATCAVRSKLHKVFRSHNELLDKGKKVGFVFGVDKPRLLRDDTNIYFSFLDIIMASASMPTNDIKGEHWENDEYFYWSPNLPELPIKQSHIAVKYLTTTNQLHLIKHISNIAKFHDQEYYNQINLAIYPDWNPITWQINKPTGAIYNEMTNWFLTSGLKAKLMWEDQLFELERICGKRWFNNNTVKDGFVGHLSPLHKICNYSLRE